MKVFVGEVMGTGILRVSYGALTEQGYGCCKIGEKGGREVQVFCGARSGLDLMRAVRPGDVVVDGDADRP